ncbi:MAG: glycoside hydrolase family 97 protein [Labilibaculum sp.]|nr:glycoside hydrolase family 97 protein [Labilibaculum sp.]MBI9057670.1 glycoside hydrolase family 97 protein [Labilibaculum sp.]
MKFKSILCLVAGLAILLASCAKGEFVKNVNSPDGKISLQFYLEEGQSTYGLSFNGKPIIEPSKLGFDFQNMPSIDKGWKIASTQLLPGNSTWEMQWGEKRVVKDHFNQLIVKLEEENAPNRKMNLVFKVYNDGIGFRYVFPKQEAMRELIITDENTQFNLTGDHKVWWIPGDWDIYEHLYHTTQFTGIDATALRANDNLAQTSIPENAVNTPVTMKTAEGIYLSFHEANLTDYAGMTLKVNKEELMLESELVGSDRTGYKVKRTLPFSTPWRTIQISESAGGLIESDLIVNLNEPNEIGSVDYFKPMKYVGIWWDMHVGTKSWDKASGKHGATTEYAKELINFAAENNIGGILVEGWNTGWEHWIGFEDREGVFDFVTPYDDYDLKEVVRYGKEKGVELIMHHETSAAPRTYNQQMDTAYQLMNSLGIHSVKTGYVGKIIPKGEYHHGQWMVNNYRRAVETGAKYKVAINAHEPIKATGLRRTYPNAIAREGLRGQEFNAWASDGGNPPEHLPIVAFTRMLAGPIDYTPGIFNIKLTPHKPNNQVNTTIAQQLALYVVINSPIQMVPDLIENYKGNDAFQFIRDVAVNWETSKVLNGEVGDFVTIARKDRNSENWFIGSITDENARDMNLSLDFLTKGKKYKATLYLDGKNAHWDKNPTAFQIINKEVDSTSKLEFHLAEGGGAAISLIEL